MIVGVKDAVKLIGISVIACCAVLVCTLFLNFYMDITAIDVQMFPEPVRIFYDAQVSTAKVVCLITGGCLLITSAVMLLFYVKHYIDIHKKQLGILKALGYSGFRIAKGFGVFGVSVLTGCAVGFGGAFLLMPRFYELQNEKQILPDVGMRFHPSLLLYFVGLPTLAFSLLAVFYACLQLKKPVLSLLRNQSVPCRGRRMSRKAVNSPESGGRSGKTGTGAGKERLFLAELRLRTLTAGKTLVFFVIFSAFCFSSMTQMAFSMKDLSSEMMGAMMLVIGLTLAFVTLFLAVTTVVRGNSKTISMMQVFGYTQKQCGKALFDGYRPLAYLGFALGTGYQYALLRIMVDLVFRDIPDVPVYRFDLPMMFVSLACFAVTYEATMYACFRRIRKISPKEIMLE